MTKYRRTNRCAWVDEDGKQCNEMILQSSTHCARHAQLTRAMKHQSVPDEKFWRIKPGTENMITVFAPNMFTSREGRYQIRLQVWRRLRRKGFKVRKPRRKFERQTSDLTIGE